MLFSKQLAENKERIATLEGQIKALTGEKEALSASIDGANAEIASLRTTNEALTAQLSEASSKAEKAVSELAATKATIEASDARIKELEAAQSDFDIKVSAAAARQLAASGHAPLNLGVDTEQKPEGKTTNTELKGRDRVVSAISTQLTK